MSSPENDNVEADERNAIATCRLNFEFFCSLCLNSVATHSRQQLVKSNHHGQSSSFKMMSEFFQAKNYLNFFFSTENLPQLLTPTPMPILLLPRLQYQHRLLKLGNAKPREDVLVLVALLLVAQVEVVTEALTVVGRLLPDVPLMPQLCVEYYPTSILPMLTNPSRHPIPLASWVCLVSAFVPRSVISMKSSADSVASKK